MRPGGCRLSKSFAALRFAPISPDGHHQEEAACHMPFLPAVALKGAETSSIRERKNSIISFPCFSPDDEPSDYILLQQGSEKVIVNSEQQSTYEQSRKI